MANFGNTFLIDSFILFRFAGNIFLQKLLPPTLFCNFSMSFLVYLSCKIHPALVPSVFYSFKLPRSSIFLKAFEECLVLFPAYLMQQSIKKSKFVSKNLLFLLPTTFETIFPIVLPKRCCVS